MNMIKRGIELLFRRRDFGLLMGAQFAAQAGDGLVQAALAKLIAFGGQKGFDIEGARSPDELLRIALYIFVPYTILSPFLGVLIDKMDRRRLMFVANGFRAIVIAIVALVGTGTIGDAPLFLAFLLTLASTRVVLATKSAAMPETLEGDSLVEANALSQLGGAIFQLGGAAVALIAAEMMDAEPIVLAGAVVYMAGAAFALGIKRAGEPRSRASFGQEVSRVVRSIIAGFREVGRTPKAGASIATYFWLRLLWSFTIVGIGFIARDLLADDDFKIAIVVGGAGAAGAVLGFVTAQKFHALVRTTAHLVIAASVVAGGAVALLGALEMTAALAGLTFFLGFGFFLGKISLDTMVQQALGDDFRGRAFSIYDIAYNVAWVAAAAAMQLFWDDDTQGVLIAAMGVLFLVGMAGIAAWYRSAGLFELSAHPTRTGPAEREDSPDRMRTPMETTPLLTRAPDPEGGYTGARRWLGHPAAFAVTGLILLALYGWTFMSNPGRVAFGDDPAFYTWRTEALISEDPGFIVEIDGIRQMLAGGYRVTTPVIGGLMRGVADVAVATPTILIAVGLRTLIPLLLGAFAYRHRRDPIVFHAVALGTGSLLLTSPFGGYLDNVLTLLFLTASLFFLIPSARSWPARIALLMFLTLSGLTHPTTLVIFCVVLGIFAVARLPFRRWDVRGLLRTEGPMLVTAFASVVLTYLIWKVGLWGPTAPLSEAAVPPPAGEDFFTLRLKDWIETMKPILNGPLLALGAVGLLARGKAAGEDELTRVSILWLAPLAGVFGFVAGLSYPYYRFFNTTLAWVLLIGLGVYFIAATLVAVAARGGFNRLALVGLLAIGAILWANYSSGLEKWNNPDEAWLLPEQKENLETLRAALEEDAGDRPIVFVIDDEVTEPVRIYGFTKFSSNVLRYALPPGAQDQAFVYLGSIENAVSGVPTERGDEEYDKLSRQSSENTNAGVEEVGGEPLYVLVENWNLTGSNVSAFESETPPEASGGEIWTVADERVGTPDGVLEPDTEDGGGIVPLLRALGGLLILLLPGYLALRWFLPDADFADSLAMVPALAFGMLISVSVLYLAVTRSEFSSGSALVATVLTIAIAAAMRLVPRRRAAA